MFSRSPRRTAPACAITAPLCLSRPLDNPLVGSYTYTPTYTPPADERYDVAVPNKTIYVSDGDLPIYQRAQELAGGNLSAAISKALKRYVDLQEGLREGFEDVVVKVGIGSGRKVRFTGVLMGEWADSSTKRMDLWRVWRGRAGKYVVHVERSA